MKDLRVYYKTLCCNAPSHQTLRNIFQRRALQNTKTMDFIAWQPTKQGRTIGVWSWQQTKLVVTSSLRKWIRLSLILTKLLCFQSPWNLQLLFIDFLWNIFLFSQSPMYLFLQKCRYLAYDQPMWWWWWWCSLRNRLEQPAATLRLQQWGRR